MKKNKPAGGLLNNAGLVEAFFEQGNWLGVVCPRPAYRFIWTLESIPGLLFKRMHDYEKFSEPSYFEVYEHEDADKGIQILVYTNRKVNRFLLPELKNIDYIFCINGPLSSELFMQQLRTLP
ncbi:MAG TPA: hypothetical protein PLP34_11340, partial [Chitinophagaceae bacterium]|nr:hypothetical protein [Chitinophagaceae bacterium]